MCSGLRYIFLHGRIKMKKHYHLYGCKRCGSAITEAFLRWAKIDYKYTELDWEKRDEWPRIIGKYNSLPQVPTLILPSGEVLTETLATAIHANKKRKGLIPIGKNEDRFWRWAIFIIANIYPTFTYGDNVKTFVKKPATQKELFSSVMKKRKSLWKTLEKECGNKWFLGNTFSAIDCYLGFMAYWTPGHDWFKKNCPKLYKISIRFKKHPSFKALVEYHRNS